MKQLVNTQEYHQKGSQILVIDNLEAGMGLYLIILIKSNAPMNIIKTGKTLNIELKAQKVF